MWVHTSVHRGIPGDTTVPLLAKGKMVTGHIWTYVRDDRPFGGRTPPALGEPYVTELLAVQVSDDRSKPGLHDSCGSERFHSP